MHCRLTACLVAALLFVAGAGVALADDPLTPEQRTAIEALIRDTLIKHPDIIIDAVKAAQQQGPQAADNTRKAIADNRVPLLADPDSPVGGNPQGDVTIVEFFDYRCPYCKEFEPTLETLLKEDGKVRVVYKEFPILGPASVLAAHVALVARAQGKYGDFHRAMMAQKGKIDDTVVLRIAASAGLDMATLREAAASEAVDTIIKHNYALAQSLDIQGTPAFVVGGTLVPGVIDIAELRQLLAQARKGG
jgi:protein-disulfide isomerase